MCCSYIVWGCPYWRSLQWAFESLRGKQTFPCLLLCKPALPSPGCAWDSGTPRLRTLCVHWGAVGPLARAVPGVTAEIVGLAGGGEQNPWAKPSVFVAVRGPKLNAGLEMQLKGAMRKYSSMGERLTHPFTLSDFSKEV